MGFPARTDDRDEARGWAKSLSDAHLAQRLSLAADYPRHYTATQRAALLREAASRIRTVARVGALPT